jgi:hypothetical protein
MLVPSNTSETVVCVPLFSTVTSGGDGPLPGTAAGSSGARSVADGITVAVLSAALVSALASVELVPPEPQALVAAPLSLAVAEESDEEQETA